MGRVTSKEEHGSSHTNPGSETARPLRSRKGRGRREQQPPSHAPLWGSHLWQHLLCAGTGATDLTGSEVWCVWGYVGDSHRTHTGQ